MPVPHTIESLRAMQAKAQCPFEKATIRMIVSMVENKHVLLDSKLLDAVYAKNWNEVDRIVRSFMLGQSKIEDAGKENTYTCVATAVAKVANFGLKDLDGLDKRPRWKLHPEFWNLLGVAVLLMLGALLVAGLVGLVFSGSKTPPEAKTCLAQLEDVRFELKNVSARLRDVEDWRTSEGFTRLANEAARDAMAVQAAKDILAAGKVEIAAIQGKTNALFKVVGGQVAAVQQEAETVSKTMAKTKASAKTTSDLVAGMSSTVATVSTTVTELNKSTKELKADLVETRHNLMEYDRWYKGMSRAGAWFIFVVALAGICLGYLGFQFGEAVRDSEFTPLAASHDMFEALSKSHTNLTKRVSALEKARARSSSAGAPPGPDR